MAWLTHTDWRAVVRDTTTSGEWVVRGRNRTDGKPRQVTVVSPGPEDFNRRAMDCARDESYLPALDPEG